MKKLLFCTLVFFSLFSCVSLQNASNLSFLDVSLNFNSDDFEVIELAPITRSAGSVMGITGNDLGSAILDRSTFKTGSGNSAGTATFFLGALTSYIGGANLAGFEQELRVPLGLLGVTIWGVYNDIIWSNTIRNKAIQRCNYALQSRYPGMDSYINPKYDIKWSKSPFGSKCTATLYAQGVILKKKTVIQKTKPLNHTENDDKNVNNKQLGSSDEEYWSSVLKLNDLTLEITQMAPNPDAVLDFESNELKEMFKEKFSIYYREFQKIVRYELFEPAHLNFAVKDIQAYYVKYIEL